MFYTTMYSLSVLTLLALWQEARKNFHIKTPEDAQDKNDWSQKLKGKLAYQVYLENGRLNDAYVHVLFYLKDRTNRIRSKSLDSLKFAT